MRENGQEGRYAFVIASEEAGLEHFQSTGRQTEFYSGRSVS